MDQHTTLWQALALFCSTPFPNLTAAFDTGLQLIIRYVDVPTAYISRLDKDEMQILVVRNKGPGVQAGDVSPIEETFCQYIRATDVPVVIADASKDVRVNNLETRTKYSIAAYLGVPVHLSDGQLYGSVCALDVKTHEFTAEQISFLQLIAQHFASMIERDQLTRLLTQTEYDTQIDLAVALGMIDSQTTLLGVVAHDLRSPLATIRGYADLILMEALGEVSDEQRIAIRRINVAARWINRLANDLLDSAAIDAQKFALLRAEYNPHVVLQQAVDFAQIQASECGLRLEIVFDADLPLMIGDADRVLQVLVNFLSNALRYTQQGYVRIGANRQGDMVEFWVEDTGPGIAPEDQERIWERHTRISCETKGLGLGLFVVRRIVDVMQGSTGVRSQVGVGSTFWARVPIIGPPSHSVQWE